MIGEGGLNLFRTNHADNPHNLFFGKIIVNAPRARLNSLLGRMWPPGHSLVLDLYVTFFFKIPSRSTA